MAPREFNVVLRTTTLFFKRFLFYGSLMIHQSCSVFVCCIGYVSWKHDLGSVLIKCNFCNSVWDFLTQFLCQAIPMYYVPREPRRDPSNCIGSMNMGYDILSDTARNRTHNLFRTTQVCADSTRPLFYPWHPHSHFNQCSNCWGNGSSTSTSQADPPLLRIWTSSDPSHPSTPTIQIPT